jgi:phosphoribosylformylglycinamidine synthase subunit PurL
LKRPRDYTADLKKLLASANICSKRWVFEQYDSMVQTNTVQGPGGEAGVMRVKGTKRGLAMALDGNGRWCYLDPKQGAKLAVAEAARKVACTGAVPVAATNCLNFGNPEKPEIMAQLSAAIDGIAEACTALGTPITGGNVSLYNETKGEGIYPTPVIGVVGILEDVTKAVPADFQRAGDTILLVFAQDPIRNYSERDLGSSEFSRVVLGSSWGTPPSINLANEASLQRTLKRFSNSGLVHSATDISDGGVLVAAAQASFANGIGADLELSKIFGQTDILNAFGEETSAVLITCAPGSSVSMLIDIMHGEIDIECAILGNTTEGRFTASVEPRPTPSEKTQPLVIDVSIAELKEAWSNALQSTLSVDTVTA